MFRLLILFSICFLLKYNSLLAKSSLKEELIQEFLLANQSTEEVSGAQKSIDYINVYESNLLTEQQRYMFYKRMINIHEIRNWPQKLKSIVLVKLVNHDLAGDIPAYKKLESGTIRFMDLVNQFITEEFSFVEDMQKNALEEAKTEGHEVSDVELSEEQRNEAIDIVYNKLKTDSNIYYLYINK